MSNFFVNFVAFQLSWLACVLGAALGHPYLGPAVVTAWLAAHLGALAGHRRTDLSVVVISAVVGYSADSALVLTGWLAFPEPARLGAPSTLWMVALWMGFALTLRHSLGWLRGRFALGAALGALCGPLAYWGGSRLGAIGLSDGSLVMIALEWMVMLPLLILAVHWVENQANARVDEVRS